MLSSGSVFLEFVMEISQQVREIEAWMNDGELPGSTFYDAHRSAPFTVKVSILLHVLDYPGITKGFNLVGSGGFTGGIFCKLEVKRNRRHQKTVYLQNRRSLCSNSSEKNGNRFRPMGSNKRGVHEK